MITPQTPETPQPTPNTCCPHPKSLTIILLLIAILLTAGGVYAGMQLEKRKVKICESPFTEITPQPTQIIDETADWKTYKNEKYGFEFMYPDYWKTEDVPNSNSLIIALDPQKVSLKENVKQALDGVNGLIEIRAGDEKNISIVGWDKFEQRTIGKNNIKVRIFEERTDDNVSNPARANKHIITYYLEDKGIIFKYISNHEDEYLTQFDQILSTFKFTN